MGHYYPVIAGLFLGPNIKPAILLYRSPAPLKICEGFSELDPSNPARSPIFPIQRRTKTWRIGRVVL